MDGMMRAARFYAPGDIRLEKVDIPRIGIEEILVEVKTALTCGTDVKMYRRGHPKIKPPMILGHEMSGIIIEVGSKISNLFEIGDRITLANSAPCNSCFYCRIGKPNLCENLLDTLIGFSVDGAFSQYIRIPSRIVKQNTYKIPNKIHYEEAALLEPLACAINGNDQSNMKLGDSVVIIGSGPIGLAHLQLAKLKGASPIVVTDLMKDRLNVAKLLGADYIVDASNEDQWERIKELTSQKGADVVIEAVGLPKTWELAVKMTRKGGTTLFFGGCSPNTTITLDTGRIHYEDRTLKGAFHHTPLSVFIAYQLISSRKFNGKPLITEKTSIQNLEKALGKMGSGESLKIAVKP